MAPIDADVAEVEMQLSTIRLRRNGLVAQRALAGALSVAILAAAAMLAVALRGSGLLFTIASALAALATVAGAAHAAWRTRRDWLSLPATAHLADAHATLDERLTTLLAVASATPPPALRPLLVEQLIGARERWGIEALAPQRLSHWLALVPLALLVFAATAFYARPPAAAAGRRASTKPLTLAAQRLVGPAEVERSAREQGLFASGGSTLTVATGSRSGAQGGDRRGAGSAAGGTDAAAAGLDTPGTAHGGAAADRPAEGGLDGLRRSIREAFGAPSESAGAGAEPGVGRETGGRGGSEHAASAGDAPRPHGAQPAGTRLGHPERADTTTSAAPSATPGTGAGAADQGSRGSARGGAGGAAAGGVLGATGAPRLDTNTTAPVTIKLNAITGVSPSETEPQRRAEGVPATASRPRPNAPLPDLANEQLADVTMQQLEIGPEHEAIIRRLFTRK